MKIKKSRIQNPWTIMLMVVGALVWVLSCGDVATAGTYADSAHGNTTYGVNRSTATCENWPGGICSTGSCAHCHDTFDPDICGNDTYGLMLFASNDNPASQTDNFCFQCHKGTGSVQVDGITNNDYGATFGGGTANSTNIKAAFDYGPPNQPENGTSGSSHNLYLVREWTRTKAAIGDWITDDTNACVVCHDPHYAQKNYPVETTGQGGVKTAIRRPHARASGTNQPSNLWGDESGASPPELTSEDPGTYQPPNRAGSGNEPAGNELPNFIRFCAYQSCHSVVIGDDAHDAYYPGVQVGRPTTSLYAINWTGTGDAHGLANPDNLADLGTTKPPYGVESTNYVLSCTDCHETHGSPNQWLLRTTVNGVNVGTFEEGYWMDFCSACHTFTEPVVHPMHFPNKVCNISGCHYHGTGYYDGF